MFLLLKFSKNFHLHDFFNQINSSENNDLFTVIAHKLEKKYICHIYKIWLKKKRVIRCFISGTCLFTYPGGLVVDQKD